MSKPPQLSNEERRAALEKAAQSRKTRAVFKLEVKQRKRNWVEAFTHQDDAIRKMRVKELFLAFQDLARSGRSMLWTERESP